MKNVLVLGAGLVSAPLVRYLLERTQARVVVATMNVDRAQRLVSDHPRGYAMYLDVADEPALENLLHASALVVSLLPQAHHVRVARLALLHRVPMITTSYVSPEMRALDDEARREGVLLLNEIGLDPGIDHMSAARIADGARREGGVVTHFSSCCGGLPAPDARTNPWGYKFSWSPRGVLLAGRNPARYLRAGERVAIPAARLFSWCWPVQIEELGRFEVYPNRDSLEYVETYRLHGIANLFRGTIRYEGWCETLRAVAKLGLLDTEVLDWPAGSTYARLATRLLPGSGPVAQRITAHLGRDASPAALDRLEWAGLLSDQPLPHAKASPLDLLSDRLQEKMSYAAQERDMVVLRHELVVKHERRGSQRIVSQLVAFGERDGDSAMARTVSLPAAIAARLILEGKIDLSGVAIPVDRQIYQPVLDELDDLGIRFREWREPVAGGAP